MNGKLMAFSGKGGSGKTTITALTVLELIRSGQGPVLAVDADPNATLSLALGVNSPGTIADLRDQTSGLEEGDVLLLTVITRDARRFVALRLPR